MEENEYTNGSGGLSFLGQNAPRSEKPHALFGMQSTVETPDITTTDSYNKRVTRARAENADMASVGYNEDKFAELMASGRGLSQISDDEFDFIRDRYSKSDISKRKAYTNSAADKFLSSAGLPSSKELNTYRQKYIDYMGNGGMEQYSQLLEKRGDNYYMTDTAEWIKNQWAKDNAEGLLGETVTSKGKDIKYEDTLLDEQLKANGFPPSAQLNEYYLKYKEKQKANKDKETRLKRINAIYDEVMELEDGGMDRQEAFDTVVQNPKYADIVEKGLVDYEELPSPTDPKYKNDTSSLDEDRTAVIKKNAKYDNMDERISLQDYEKHRSDKKKWAKYAEQQSKLEPDFKSALVTPATTESDKKKQYEAISKYLSTVKVTKDDGSLLTADDYSGYLHALNAGIPIDVINKAQQQGFSAYEDWNNTANGKDLNKWAETKAMLDGLSKDDGVYNNAVSLYRETHAATGLSNYSKDSKYDPSLYDAQISPEMSTSRSTAVSASGAIYNAVNGKGYGNVVGASESQRELLKDLTDKTLSDSSLIDLMSDDEKGTFNLIFKESAKRGLDYLQRLQPVLEQRRDNVLFGKVMFASSKENAEDSAYKLNLSASIDEINDIKEGTSSYWKKEAWDRYSNYSDEALQRIIDDANEKLNSAPTQPLTVQMYDEEEANGYHDLIKNVQFVLDTRKQARDDARVTSALYGYKEEDGKKATEEISKRKAQDLPDELSRFINGKKVIQNDANDINVMASTDAFSAYTATSESRLSTEEQLFIDNMTEDQKNRYNWLLLHGEKGDAQKYFDYIKRGIDKKAAASVTAGFKEFGKENPFVASVGSVLTYPIGGMSAVLGSVDRLISGKEISDTNAALWDITGSLREGVQERISDSFENEGFANTLNFLYNVGMSSADSFLGAVISKATVPFAGELMLSASAYASTLRAGLTRGLDREKAVQMAVASAAIEFVTEHMGIDNLVSGLENIAEKAAAKGSTSYMMNVLAQMGINFIPEALEEGVGNVFETMADMMINGDASELMEYYDSLIAKGMSKEEANKLVANKFAKETALEMLAGGLAGAESVGVGGTLNYGKVAAAHGVSAWASPETTRAWSGTHSKDFGKGKAIVDSVFGKEFSDSVQGYIDTKETVLDKRNINEISELLPQMRNTDSLYDYVFDEKGNVKLSNEELVALSSALNSAGAEADLDSIEQAYADFMADNGQSARQRLANTNYKYIKTSQELHDARVKLNSLQKDVENAKRDYQGELDKANTALKDSEARLQAVNEKINAIESAIASRVGGDTTKLSSQLNALLSSQSALITEVNNHQNALNKVTGEKKRNLDTTVSNCNTQIRDIQRSLDRHWASYSNLLATSTTKRSAYEAQYRFASLRVAEIGNQIDSLISSDTAYFADPEKYLERMEALQTQLAEAQQEADFWDRKRNKTAPSKLSDAIAAAHSGTVKEFLDSTEPAKATAPATANTANTAETANTPSNTAEQANQPSDAVKQENTAQGETAENATEEKKPKQKTEEKKEEPEKAVEKKTYTISKTTQEKFNRIASKFGLEIVWQTRDEIGGNGRYSSKEPNKIYLATDMIADKGLLKETVVAREFFTHEVVHYVATTQWYQRLSNLAEAWYRYSGDKEYGGGSGDDYFEFLIGEQIKQEKELHNRDFTREQAREELTAYFVQDVLFEDKNGSESLDWLTKMDGNAVQNFLVTVEYLINRGKARRMKDGSAIKTLLLDAEHALGQAIRERKVLDAAGLSSSFSTEKKNAEQKNTAQTQQTAQNQKNADNNSEENAEPAQPVAEQKNAEQPAEQAQPVAEEPKTGQPAPKTEQFPNYWVAENDWNTAKKDIGSFDAYDTVMFVANNMGMEVGTELVNASDANSEDNGVYDKVDDIVSTLSESGVSPAAVATFLNTIYKDGGIDAIKNIPTGEGEANDAIVSAVKQIDSEHGSGMYSVGTTIDELSQGFTATESERIQQNLEDQMEYEDLAEAYSNGTISESDRNKLQDIVRRYAERNGYATIPLYHGTNWDFNEFYLAHEGIHLGTREQAEDILDNRERTLERESNNSLNKRVMELYAKVNNPLVIDRDIQRWYARNIAMWLDPDGANSERSFIKAISEQTGLSVEEVRNRLVEPTSKLDDAIWYEETHDYEQRTDKNDVNAWKKGREQSFGIIRDILTSFGFDSIKYKNEVEGNKQDYSYIVFNPSDVKSADPVTYDSNGNIIPLNERFNAESNDIRYSAGTTISDLASRFNPNVSGRAATLSGDDIAVPSTTEAIDKSAVLVNENGDPVMNVVNNGNGAMFSTGTWDKGGKDAFKKYLDSKKISEDDIQKATEQMESIYKICRDLEGKHASFSQWADAEVTKNDDGTPVFSVIRSNSEYPMNLDFSLVCVKRRALDAVFNEVIKQGKMEDIILDDQAIVLVNEAIRKAGYEAACTMCFVEAKRFQQSTAADRFVEKYNKLVKSLGGDADYFNFGGNGELESHAGIQHMSDSNLDFTEIDRVLQEFTKRKNKKIPKYNPNKGVSGMNVEEAIAYELKNNPASRRLVLRGDFMSTKGFDSVAKNAPNVLTLYNKQKGTGGPKASFGDMQYLNDIEKKSWDADKAYAVGGVRVQSFSDFVPYLAFDYVQMVADLAAGGLPSHAYTKEKSFALLFGLTGMKINMSLVPMVADDGLDVGLMYERDANGNIVLDENGQKKVTYAWATESFGFDRKNNRVDYDFINRIQSDSKYGKNCGTIAIGVSDKHIERMMADPAIKMIIPYHKSSLNPVVAKMEHIDAFDDYTKTQHTRKKVVENGETKWKNLSAKEEYPFNTKLRKLGDPKAVVADYLAWCEKHEYAPKFEKDNTSTKFKNNEGYYKVLEDFTLYDSDGNYVPQEAVKLNFPTDTDIEGSFSQILDKALGDYEKYRMITDADTEKLAKEVLAISDRRKAERESSNKTMYSGGTTINDLSQGFNPNQESALRTSVNIKDGVNKSTGEPVNFIDLILDGRKKGETRNSKGLPVNKWVGIHKNGQVLGRVIFGNPIPITKNSPEYKDAYIEGTDFDIEDGQEKYYYPILDVEDFRDNPIPTAKGHNSPRYSMYGNGTTISDLSQGYTPRESINDVRKIFNQRDSRSSGVDDAEYMELAEKYDSDNGNRNTEWQLDKMVEKAAKAAGYDTPKLYHGTPSFGFTSFSTDGSLPWAKRGYIYASTKREVSANYGGRDNYAGVRNIGRAYDGGSSAESIIKDAKSVFGSSYAVPTEEEVADRIRKDYSEANKIQEKLNELYVPFSNYPYDVSNAIDWISFIPNVIVDNDLSFDGGVDGILNATQEERSRLKADIEDAFNRAKEYKYEETIRNYFSEHRNEMSDKEKEFFRYLMSYDFGDALIDFEYGLVPLLEPSNLLINKVNGSFQDMSKLREALDQTHSVGSYQLYGDLGDKPFIFDANGSQFWALKVPEVSDDYTDTDTVCKWAKANGYTSVVMKNIYDYGDKADNYVFFDSNQVKSADPVTYRDNGEIIPLSERFSDDKDIRYSNGTTMKDLIASYGKKRQSGLGMLNDVQTAERTSKSTRISDVAQTVKEAPAQATQEWKDHVDDIVVEVLDENAVPVVKVGKDAGLVYRPMTMEEMNELGDEYITRSGGVDQAMRDLARDIPNATVSDLTRLEAAAMRVIAEVSKTNNFNREDSAEFLAALGILNSNWGRMGKAMQLLNNSPLGRRKYMEKVIERINAENKKKFSKGAERLFHRNGVKEIVIPESKLRDLELATTPEEVRKAEFRISEEIGKQSPLSISDAIRNWRYFAMLANPVTHGRNLLGNTGMLGMRMAKDAIAAGLENVAVKTGFMDAEDRTHYVNRAIPKEVADYAVQLFLENAEQVQGQDRYGVRDKIHDAVKKSPIKLFDWLMRFNGDMLEKEDKIFLRMTYVSAAKQYMMARGLTNVNDLTAKQKAEIHQHAKQQAQEATYRDASALADTLNALAKKGGAWQFAIESTIPFKKTPINITKRGIEYSPAGLAKGVIDLAKYAINKGKNADGQYRIPASKIADELGKGLVGSALALIGAFLSKAGILKLKAGSGNDRDDAYEKDLGHQDYSLEIGNMSIKIESLVPMTFPLFAGAAVVEAMSSEEKKGFIPAMSEAILSIADPIMDMSFMSSLNNTLNSYSKNKLLGIAQNAVSSYAGQFAPTVIGRLNSSLYPTRRTTKSSQKAKEGIGTENDYTLRSIASKTPLLNLALEPYVKTTGEYDVKDSFGDYLLAHFDAFLLPVNVQMIDTNPIKNEIVRLVESTGTVDFVPQNPQKYFKDGDTTYNLTAKEYTEYSKDHNETVYAMLKDVINSEEYQNAETDDDRANLLKKAYSKSHEVARKKWKAIIIERHSNN